MASGASTTDEKEEKVKKKRKKEKKKKEVQAEDIEVLTSDGHRALQEGRNQDAVSCFNAALKAAQELEDRRVQRACSFNLGAAYVEAGQPQEGLDFLRQAQPGPKADRLPDLQFNLGLAHNALGQDQEAAVYFLQAAQLYRSQGDGGSEGDACVELSHCYSRTKDWSQAAQSFVRAAESYRLAGMLDSAAVALKEAGSAMVQSDQFSHDDIISILTECLSLKESITDLGILGEMYLSVGVSYCRLRCFSEAVQCFRQALRPSAQRPPLLAKVMHNLGAALNSEGQYSEAVTYSRLAAGLYGSLGCRGDQAQCFSNLALACSKLGDEEEAAESFIHALQGFKDSEDHLAEAQVCESLAELYLKQRRKHKAVQLYKQALSALTHCTQDTSNRVRDHLVERLTAALQQGQIIHRPRPPRRHPHNPPVEHPVRKSDITQSPRQASNQQPDHQRREGVEQGTIGGSANEASGFMSTPEPISSERDNGLQNGERWSDRENQPTDSETSLVQEPQAPPSSPGVIRNATSPAGWWRSAFCSLM